MTDNTTAPWIEDVLASHRINGEGECTADGCDWRGPATAPVLEFLAAHRAHVAAAIRSEGAR